jgi:lipopolysaccharide transport system ATP-binding protein
MARIPAIAPDADREDPGVREDAPVIEVEGVSKRYSRSLRRSLWYGIRDIGKEVTGRGQHAETLRESEFWALRNVSFVVGHGETVGLIGHNGAGKTTLLKLINGLIKPSTGRIAVHGSVRALIALDAGFNPVLTGRENVKVASAVLGMSQREAAQRLEEIVEFAEIDEFIDAPIRTYSSGMLARLGFSIAVHTRPDILLVDEVLAVGDLNFAIKCYRKINEFRNNGGSIVLVSHNAYTIRSNCDRVVWIEHGGVQQIGATEDVCDAYEAAVASEDTVGAGGDYSDGSVSLIAVRHPEVVDSGAPFAVELELEVKRPLEKPILSFTVSTMAGQAVVANTSAADGLDLRLEVGRNVLHIAYDELPLMRGIYGVSVVVAEGTINNQVLAALNKSEIEIRVQRGDLGAGVVYLHPTWSSIEPLDASAYADSQSRV